MENPPQLIPEESDGFEDEAGITVRGEELALFCEDDMLEQALAMEQDSVEIINGLVDEPAHTRPNPDHQPLVTIEVKKGESTSTPAAFNRMYASAALNGMYFCPGEGGVAQKQKRLQPADAKKDTKKEKRAKCR